MSRCLPFPPPGYLRNNGERSVALIESIKLQREIEKAKKDRKREKKEKKREKKERKEKKESKLKGATSLASDGKKLNLIDELKGVKADGKLQKAEENENEQRSGITEEYDQAVSLREPCCLSDSTQSSGKRKRSCSPSSQDHGPAIKIRLPLRKHSEPEESKPEKQVVSSKKTGGIADSFTQDSRGTSHQLQQELKSDFRHCKAEAKNLVYGDASVTNNTKLNDKTRRVVSSGRTVEIADSLTQDSRGGSSHHLKQKRTANAVTNAITVKPDSRQCKPATHNLVHGNALITNNNKVDDKTGRVVSSGRTVGIADSLIQDSRGGSSLQFQQGRTANAATDHIPVKSDSRQCKAEAKNLVHGDAMVTNKKVDDRVRRVASLYDSMFQNLLTCEPFNTEDDQDWLFGSKMSDSMPVSKKVKSDADASRCSTTSLWPRAQFLPEVDIYALPYTVPF